MFDNHWLILGLSCLAAAQLTTAAPQHVQVLPVSKQQYESILRAAFEGPVVSEARIADINLSSLKTLRKNVATTWQSLLNKTGLLPSKQEGGEKPVNVYPLCIVKNSDLGKAVSEDGSKGQRGRPVVNCVVPNKDTVFVTEQELEHIVNSLPKPTQSPQPAAEATAEGQEDPHKADAADPQAAEDPEAAQPESEDASDAEENADTSDTNEPSLDDADKRKAGVVYVYPPYGYSYPYGYRNGYPFSAYPGTAQPNTPGTPRNTPYGYNPAGPYGGFPYTIPPGFSGYPGFPYNPYHPAAPTLNPYFGGPLPAFPGQIAPAIHPPTFPQPFLPALRAGIKSAETARHLIPVAAVAYEDYEDEKDGDNNAE